MITAIRHTGLVVADLDAALQFWCELLQFRVHKRALESGPHLDRMMGLTDVQVTTVKLAAPDGNLVELLHFHSHPDRASWAGTPNSTGFTHMAFSVSDVDAMHRTLSEAGVTFNSPPHLSPDGYAKLCYCRGPEGVLLELVQVLQP